MTKPPEKLGAAYYRGFLSPQGQAFYDRLQAQLLRGDFSGKISFPISAPETSAADGFAAYKAIRDDHPEYFYLGRQSQFTRHDHTGTLQYPILYTPEIIERIRKQLRKSIYRIVRGTANLPMIEREELVYERIAKKLAYDNHDDVRDHSIVGPVLLSSGVCEGHNALLLLCFRRIGIPCIKVYGKTKTGGWHCWTVAWINETPVHCDVTWDGTEDGVVRFDYLNLSDRQIESDHFDFKGVCVPVCPSEALSYYQYHDLCVRSFEELKMQLRTESQQNKLPIRMHFCYRPPSDDTIGEVQRAFDAEQIRDKYKLYYHPTFHNLAANKIPNKEMKPCINRLSEIRAETG